MDLEDLLPVIIGGVIGISGAVLSSWLNAYLAEKRLLRKQRADYAALVGKREALQFVSRDALRGVTGETIDNDKGETMTALFERHTKMPPMELARLIGYEQTLVDFTARTAEDSVRWAKEIQLAQAKKAVAAHPTERPVPPAA